MTPDRPVVLITGGAKRVGRAICFALARSGCDIHFTYRSSNDEAKSLCTDLELLRVKAMASRLDFEDLDAIERFAAELAQRGRLDVLIHNASIYSRGLLNEITQQDAIRHYQINALAPLLLTRHLAPRLAESPRPGGGSIVAMTDIHASDRPRKAFTSYAMSKAALEQMVRLLAVELAPKVRVNAVAPGVVAFAEEGEDSDPAMQERYLKRVPMGRSGTIEEAAEAVRWLALDASYTTGQVLRVDGGRWLT